jgi:hypothetical protein
MERSRSSGSGVARLLAEIKPRWTRERHERVFAAIIERIRAERADDDADDDDDHGARYGQLEGGHAHA